MKYASYIMDWKGIGWFFYQNCFVCCPTPYEDGVEEWWGQKNWCVVSLTNITGRHESSFASVAHAVRASSCCLCFLLTCLSFANLLAPLRVVCWWAPLADFTHILGDSCVYAEILQRSSNFGLELKIATSLQILIAIDMLSINISATHTFCN